MKERGKRGQFYLVAAIVIVAVIIGLVGVSNYAKQKPKVTVYDLNDELGIESSEIVEYGVFNYGGDADLLEFLGDFTELYTEYAGEGKDLYFVYGDEDGVTIIKYEEVLKGEVSLSNSKYKVTGKKVNKTEGEIDPVTKIVSVEIGNTVREFTLSPGENFYYVLTEVVGDEKHIVSSQ